MVSLLLTLLASPLVLTAYPVDQVPKQFILVRHSTEERTPWKDVDLASEGSLLEVFGPDGRFGLFRGNQEAVVLPEGFQIQPNFLYHLSSDPDYWKSWGLKNTGQTSPSPGIAGKDIGAHDAWAIHTGEKGVVAIVDTGIDIDHEELKNRLWVNNRETIGNGIDDDGNGYIDDKYGWNFVLDNSDVQDENDHGTFCAGIIGAEANNGHGSRGIHWNVKLMGLKFMDKNGVGSTVGAIKAIDYAVKNGASIINASWGATQYDQALYDSVKWAGEQGVLFVAAAGNDAKNNDLDSHPSYPAAFRLPRIVSVAAYDNRDELASFSNFGKETTHIGAPGVSVYSTVRGGFRVASGTSFAAPHVAGTAILLLSFLPTLSVVELRERLLSTSEVIRYYEKERTQSAGRVHAYNALKDIRPIRPLSPSNWNSHLTTLETPHPYANNALDTFEVKHPGAKYIRVHFESFETEKCYDKVTLRDMENKSFMTYCGERESFWSTEAVGDTLRIEFQSDYITTGYGFRVDKYEVSGDGE